MADCTEVLSQLYLALLGEQCIFTKPRITGLELRINEEVVQRLLPLEQYQDVVKVAELSGYVRVIECLYKKRNFGAETSPVPFPESDTIKIKNISQDDAIKKAIVESILADYNVYVNSADKMRSEHICAKGKHSVGDLFYFTAIWHKRLRFVRHLIKIVEENNGMRTMNMIFQEWASMFCCKDWEHRLLEHALHQASKALLNVCAAWLLDGNLLGATSWMIASEQATSPSRRSCNSFSTSFNSISSMEPFNTSQVVKNDSPQKVDKIPAEVLLIDPELIPTALAHCPELTNLILDVGKKVRFLKMLRRCRSYEHRLEERKLLIDSLKPEIWYRTAQRGALHIAVQKLHRIVCQDILFELMQRQRLVDHLTLVHSYFFNLRGELFAELERTIQVTFIKPSSLYYQTPMSVRKRSSNSTKMPELIMNQALSRCSPPSNIADLMSLLSTNRASRDKSKSFFESFGISYDVSKANGRRTREGRSSQFGNFFSRRLINIYERVFKNVANLQLLRFHLDEISHRFTHNTCPKVRSRKGKSCQPLTTFIHFHLNFLRQFLTRLGNYMFEEVLLLESAKILGAIQRETDPHGLLCQHENQLSTIMRALFIYSGAAPVSEILLATIRNGRAFVDAVENFCDAIDKNCQQQQKPQTPLSMHEENNNGRSAKIEITALGRQGRKTRISSDQLGKVEQHLFTLQDSSTQFKSSHLQLRTILEQCLGDGSKQQSIYWPKLHSLLFDHH